MIKLETTNQNNQRALIEHVSLIPKDPSLLCHYQSATFTECHYLQSTGQN